MMTRRTPPDAARPGRCRARRVLWLLVLVLACVLLAACGNTDAEQNDPTAAANFEAQKLNDPVPQLQDSLERANVIEHLRRNNLPDRVRFIYLLADTGGIYTFFVVKGKVTSTSAQLTPTDDFARKCVTCDWSVVQGPTDDGSFGGNEGGIYFFTADGVEVQWNGRWLLSDEPLVIKNPTMTLETR